MEDLRVSRMVHNHFGWPFGWPCLSKSIHDAAWSGFFSMLFYKAEEAGRTHTTMALSKTCLRGSTIVPVVSWWLTVT
ncbi:MAG: hypothetical protein WCS37_07895 [Chloroflexota bacterium]